MEATTARSLACLSSLNLLPSALTTFCQASPCLGFASQQREMTALRVSSVPCCVSSLYQYAHASPKSGFSVTALLNHVRAFSSLRSAWKRRATVQMTKGSFSQFLMASTLLALRCCRGSNRIASDHRIPLCGHSCSACARRVDASFLPPSCAFSRRIVSSQRGGDLGFLRRAFSSSERALFTCPASISKRTATSQRLMLRGHLTHPSA
mmetsp:Transcript_23097/g.56932  ORF Transcript_23097/g.56932 Transcript_23097/m.56932 type:complete len:208 (+) Transcript_23097:105-728(+)